MFYQNVGNRFESVSGWHLFILILPLAFALQLYSALGTELHPDEAYYWVWSTRLDWSYYDQGPLTAFYIKFFTFLLGDTLLALKTAAVFAYVTAAAFFLGAARELGFSPLRGGVALAMFLLVPGFFNGSQLIMHDSPLLLAWNAALFFALRHIRCRDNLALFALFITLGLGALAKHTMVFFAFGLVLWLLLCRARWPLLRKRSFWAALILAGVMMLPHLIWNLQNDWAGIGAIVHLRSSGGKFANRNGTGELLVSQFLLFSPLWLAAFVALVLDRLIRPIRGFLAAFKEGPMRTSFGWRRWLRIPVPHFFRPGGRWHESSNRGSQMLLLWINALLLPLYLLFFSLNHIVQPNWVFPAYPAAILLVASRWPEGKINPGKKWMAPLILFGFVPVLILNLATRFSGELVELLPAKPAAHIIPAYRSVGYRAIIREITEIKNRRNPKAELAANRYQDAAIAQWYSPGKKFVGSLNILQRNQYSYWPFLRPGRDYFIFFIQENVCERTPLFFKIALKEMFESLEEYPEREIVVDDLKVRRYHLWYARNYRQPWDEKLFRYLDEEAILHLMPNLNDTREMEINAGNLERMNEYMNSVFWSQAGQLDRRNQKHLNYLKIIRNLMDGREAWRGCSIFK